MCILKAYTNGKFGHFQYNMWGYSRSFPIPPPPDITQQIQLYSRQQTGTRERTAHHGKSGRLSPNVYAATYNREDSYRPVYANNYGRRRLS